jgi:hypothetical protein
MDPAHYSTDPEATGPASPQDLVRHLRGYEGMLPDAVRRPLVAAGGPLVPALIALVEDALADDQTDLGWAPLHAVDLLGALGDARALPVLLRCLDREDELDLLVEHAEAALRALGAHALEACVAAYAATTCDAVRDRLAGVMSHWGLHDERIYAALVDTLQRTPELGANYLVDYGDVRALDVLAQTFDVLPLREGATPVDNHVFIELRCAIEDLGGALDREATGQVCAGGCAAAPVGGATPLGRRGVWHNHRALDLRGTRGAGDPPSPGHQDAQAGTECALLVWEWQEV